MKYLSAILVLSLTAGTAQAAGGRYSCKAGQHSLSFDFGRMTLTLDGETAAMTKGVATYWATPGSHKVIIAPSEKGSIFDVSVDQGKDYSGFVICKPN